MKRPVKSNRVPAETIPNSSSSTCSLDPLIRIWLVTCNGNTHASHEHSGLSKTSLCHNDTHHTMLSPNNISFVAFELDILFGMTLPWITYQHGLLTCLYDENHFSYRYVLCHMGCFSGPVGFGKTPDHRSIHHKYSVSAAYSAELLTYQILSSHLSRTYTDYLT